MTHIGNGLKVSDAPWSNEVMFAYFESDPVRVFVAKPFEMVEVERSKTVNPTFTLSPEQVQELFNRLWMLGYRPKDGTGNSGHIAALQYHLEDMRRLVFKDGTDAG